MQRSYSAIEQAIVWHWSQVFLAVVVKIAF